MYGSDPPEASRHASLPRVPRSARPPRRRRRRRRDRAGEAAAADEDRGDARRPCRGAGRRDPGLGGGGPDRARRAGVWRLATRRARRSSMARPGIRRATRRWPRRRGRPGVLVNIVDDLEGSDFITPAIVDRDPVTVAIGTEGAAPVLARKIKAEIEELLPVTLGLLTRIGQGVPRPGRGARFEGAAGVLDPVLLRARPAGAGGRRGGGARRARGDAGRGRRAAAGLRAPGRHRSGRSGADDAEGAPAAARGRRGDPRPAGAGGDPRARAPRGDDRRGRQDRLRAVVEAGRHQRADRAARARRARRSCG